MRNKTLLSLSLASLLFTSMISQAATYYRWVDDNKVTHYTTDVPEGREYEVVKTIGGKGISPQSSSSSSSKQESTAANSSSSQTAIKKDNTICEQAKANLKMMQEHSRIRQKDEYGNEIILSEEQKEKEIQRAKEAVKTYC